MLPTIRTFTVGPGITPGPPLTGCQRVVDYHHRFGITPTPEHVTPVCRSLPCPRLPPRVGSPLPDSRPIPLPGALGDLLTARRSPKAPGSLPNSIGPEMRAAPDLAFPLVRDRFVLVGDTGFEPVTSSVSRKRATTAPIARGRPGSCSRWRRDLNPCTRLCRPLPRLSATPPNGGQN